MAKYSRGAGFGIRDSGFGIRDSIVLVIPAQAEIQLLLVTLFDMCRAEKEETGFPPARE
jgi:hypothetical protein